MESKSFGNNTTPEKVNFLVQRIVEKKQKRLGEFLSYMVAKYGADEGDDDIIDIRNSTVVQSGSAMRNVNRNEKFKSFRKSAEEKELWKELEDTALSSHTDNSGLSEEKELWKELENTALSSHTDNSGLSEDKRNIESEPISKVVKKEEPIAQCLNASDIHMRKPVKVEAKDHLINKSIELISAENDQRFDALESNSVRTVLEVKTNATKKKESIGKVYTEKTKEPPKEFFSTKEERTGNFNNLYSRASSKQIANYSKALYPFSISVNKKDIKSLFQVKNQWCCIPNMNLSDKPNKPPDELQRKCVFSEKDALTRKVIQEKGGCRRRYTEVKDSKEKKLTISINSFVISKSSQEIKKPVTLSVNKCVKNKAKKTCASHNRRLIFKWRKESKLSFPHSHFVTIG